ncbi:uncharacterized protein RJT20DRAFT_147187 [Scheffersomyces xylosifermentans]|uniref:uncharacterized protein n=1 Tax=Scheffersomyces xylosifermentans TaxID=1304137 RepID=UPI00315DB68F
MSVVSLEISKDNSITRDDLHKQLNKLGVSLRREEENDYYTLLAAMDKSIKKIMEMEDYHQPTDLVRFPRKNIHRAVGSENVNNAWAFKVDIEDTKPELSKYRPLEGRTICFKDCIEIAGVPQIGETDCFEPQVSLDRAPPNVKNGLINGLYLIENYPGLYAKTINLSFKARAEYDKALDTPGHGDRSTLPIERILNTVGLNANTGIFDITRHPALSLPIGFLPSEEDPDMRFPVGIQLNIGKHFTEEKLYTVAYAWEQAFNWKDM